MTSVPVNCFATLTGVFVLAALVGRRSGPAWRCPRRPAALVGAALASTLGLAGCSTGFGAQTTELYTAPDGTDVRDGDVEALNVLIVANDAGSGTLVAALVNQTEQSDRLDSVSATDPDLGPGAGAITVADVSPPLDLPPTTLVQLADPAVAAEIGPVVLEGDTVDAGQTLQVTLTFAKAAPVVAEVPVVPRAEPYESVPTPADTGGRGAGGG